METAALPSARSVCSMFDQHRHRSRKVLLEFLLNIPRGEFVRPFPDFHDASIRDILVHMVNTSGYWISVLQNRGWTDLDPDSFATIESILPLVDEVSDRIANVLSSADEPWFAREQVFGLPGGRTEKLVPAWIAVHVLTHEYHHKGQITLLARRLGFSPPDTDFV